MRPADVIVRTQVPCHHLSHDRQTGFIMVTRILATVLVSASIFAATPTFAAQCGGDFQTFVGSMSREAQAAGISQATISEALGGVTQDAAVLAFDRRQRGTFNKTFEQYVATRVGPGRIKTGKTMLLRHASLLSRIEQQYGVPAEILVAIWGLESDFGKGDMGKLPVFRVLTTMAHDCRRTDLFQGELLAALNIVQRGDLTTSDMIGAYAGEIGQTQFLPSSYIKYGVDFDGNGHVDLRHSVPDVLASTANLLKTNGWKTGGDYHEGSANFDAMREWNRAEIYRKTIAYFADRLAAP
jgi:lytic murein transglycosylase